MCYFYTKPISYVTGGETGIPSCDPSVTYEIGVTCDLYTKPISYVTGRVCGPLESVGFVAHKAPAWAPPTLGNGARVAWVGPQHDERKGGGRHACRTRKAPTPSRPRPPPSVWLGVDPRGVQRKARQSKAKLQWCLVEYIMVLLLRFPRGF